MLMQQLVTKGATSPKVTLKFKLHFFHQTGKSETCYSHQEQVWSSTWRFILQPQSVPGLSVSSHLEGFNTFLCTNSGMQPTKCKYNMFIFEICAGQILGRSDTQHNATLRRESSKGWQTSTRPAQTNFLKIPFNSRGLTRNGCVAVVADGNLKCWSHSTCPFGVKQVVHSWSLIASFWQPSLLPPLLHSFNILKELSRASGATKWAAARSNSSGPAKLQGSGAKSEQFSTDQRRPPAVVCCKRPETRFTYCSALLGTFGGRPFPKAVAKKTRAAVTTAGMAQVEAFVQSRDRNIIWFAMKMAMSRINSCLRSSAKPT